MFFYLFLNFKDVQIVLRNSGLSEYLVLYQYYWNSYWTLQRILGRLFINLSFLEKVILLLALDWLEKNGATVFQKILLSVADFMDSKFVKWWNKDSWRVTASRHRKLQTIFKNKKYAEQSWIDFEQTFYIFSQKLWCKLDFVRVTFTELLLILMIHFNQFLIAIIHNWLYCELAML